MSKDALCTMKWLNCTQIDCDANRKTSPTASLPADAQLKRLACQPSGNTSWPSLLVRKLSGSGNSLLSAICSRRSSRDWSFEWREWGPMSKWRDEIIRKFTPSVGRAVLVADPDRLLTEPTLNEGLRG